MSKIRIAMEQEIELQADGHHWREVNTLIAKDEDGVGANHGDKVEKTLKLDLGKLKYPIKTQKKKKGVVKNVSIEDQYMMGQIQAACSGKLIKNKYFLAVRCTFDGCTCCSATPYARIPLNILPKNNPECFMPMPSNWKPK